MGDIMDFDLENFKTEGIKVNYYYVCKRKLWLFDKGITMENKNDRVMQGKVIHENSYPSIKTKEILIDDILKVDILDNDYVKEIKISSRMPKPGKMQLMYYLFYLKQLGIEKKGMLNYVKEKKTETVELTAEKEEEIKNTLIDIKKILAQKIPPKLKKLPYCRKCAYFEFCFINEN